MLKNTVMLYVLTFSTYLLSFITVPYETRILGPEKYGLLGVASAVMIYFRLVIDFGFLSSATADVASIKDDRDEISRIFSAVTYGKIALSLVSSAALFVLCGLVDQWQDSTLLFFLYFLSTALTSLLPDFLYRGLEKMEAITVRAVLIRLFFTLMIFIFVRSPSDFIFIPLLQIIGNLAALVGVYFHISRKLNIRFVLCSWYDVFDQLKRSFTFFLSRIATTAYTASNTIILDLISGGSMTAFYTSADRLVSTAKSGMSPIADSLYPYMIKNKDFKLSWKILLVLEPIIFAGCTVVFVFAKPLCVWFFGSEYEFTASVLRTLLPIVVFTLPTYVFGFPVLGALGLNKHVNYSVMVGSAFHIIGLVVLFFVGAMNVISLGILTSATELLILSYRLIVFKRNYARINRGN